MKNQPTTSGKMGLWQATSIGVGAMIGAGLFALVGITAEIAGSLAYISFGIAGIVTLFTTYSFARLAVRFPSKGGPVEYINQAFGSGLFSGGINVTMWIGYMIVTSLYARAFGEYGVALMNLEDPVWLHILSSGIILIFVAVNFIGASTVGNSELAIVAVKVLILLAFGALGLATANGTMLVTATGTDLNGIILASGIVFMSYEGFGLVANTAEDLKNPGKNLPKALFLSVLIVMAIYILVTLAVFGNITPDKIVKAKEYALAEAARPILGSLGFTIMGVAALFSTSSAINATIYGPVHMLQETAKAGQSPAFFMRRLFRHESGTALVITGAIVLAAANLLNLEEIAETGSMIFLIIYSVVNVANLKLHRQTKSKRWLIWIAITGTSASFIALLYYQIADGSLSTYLLAAILILCYGYEYLNQKYFKRDSSHEQVRQ